MEDPYLLLENLATISKQNIGLNGTSKDGDSFFAEFYVKSNVSVPFRVKVLLGRCFLVSSPQFPDKEFTNALSISSRTDIRVYLRDPVNEAETIRWG